jgi:hypothetical protein
VDKSDFPDTSTGHHRASQGHSRMPGVSWEIAFDPGNPGSESNFPDVGGTMRPLGRHPQQMANDRGTIHA